MILPLDVLLDELLEDLVGHPPVVLGGQEILLVQVETVRAVQVTHRPGRLCHDMKSGFWLNA